MKPGRELDALIAEKVMGYKVFRWGDSDSLFVAPNKAAFDYACNGDTLTCYVDSERGFCFTMSNYSTKIEDAWQVIEHLITNSSWEFYLTHQYNGWNCLFESPDKPIASGSADTAPHAICLAALEVVK